MGEEGEGGEMEGDEREEVEEEVSTVSSDFRLKSGVERRENAPESAPEEREEEEECREGFWGEEEVEEHSSSIFTSS